MKKRTSGKESMGNHISNDKFQFKIYNELLRISNEETQNLVFIWAKDGTGISHTEKKKDI